MNIHTEKFEKTVNVFIQSVEKYFNHLTKIPVSTQAPYVKSSEELILKECTGMIGISGTKKGFIYLSGELALFESLIQMYVGINNPTENNMLDMAGEVCNVVAGNVRETYGDEFMISVPIVFKGKLDSIKFPDNVPIYVIPLKWKGHEAFMVVGLA